MDKVSIIVPVYNSSQYIDQCIQSILVQSYKKFEVLIINDGSTDNSLTICRKWSSEDSRIRLYNNNNNGVSYSRNFGIDCSTGKYIVFVDSDDIISPDYIKTLVELIEQYQADCAVVGISKFKNVEENMLDNHNDFKIKVFKKENISKALFTDLEGFLCNKIYRADIIKKQKLRLDENIYICEDLIFNALYFQHCNLIVFKSGAKYFYRIYGSSSFNNLSNPQWFSVLDAYKSIFNIYKNDISVKNIILYNFMMILYEARYRVNLIKPVDDELKKKVEQLIDESSDATVDFTITKKIKLILFKYFPSLVMKYKRRNLRG